MTRFFCDICNAEVTGEQYREPRPNETKLVASIEETMCPECVKAFGTLNVKSILCSAVINARPDIPKER